MIYHGRILNGVAVIDSPTPLPEGAVVRVEIRRKDDAFWSRRSVQELAAEQGVPLNVRSEDLAIDWPPEDSVDELMALVREVRR